MQEVTRSHDRRGDTAALPAAVSPSSASFPVGEVVLRQLAADEDDRFGVMTRCAHGKWTAALLVDSSRLYARTVLYVSHAATALGPPPWSDGVIERLVDHALEDILVEDEEMERACVVEPDPSVSPHAFITQWFGLEAGLARPATVRFNRLPIEVRRVFFAVVLDGRSIADCASQGLGSRSTMHAALQDAFRALSLLPSSQGGTAGGRES